MSAVVVQDLSLRYPSENPDTRSVAVNGVSFTIEPGEVLAVVELVQRARSRERSLWRPTSRPPTRRSSAVALTVLGTPVRGISARKRDRLQMQVGYLRQEAGDFLEPRLTVGENVAEPIFSRDRR